MQPKILITGGSGFIGTNLLELYLSKKYKVVNFDIIIPIKKSHLVFWQKVDICHFDSLKIALIRENPDYIVHLAAITDLNEKDGLDYYNTNIQGVENLVEILKGRNKVKRVIFTSTMLVNELGYKPKNIKDYNPVTSYGRSKVIGEELVLKNAQKLPSFCIIRPTSIWGEWFKEPYETFFELVLRRRFFHPGSRSCTKTYGYVGNAVYQIDKLLHVDSKNLISEVYYIGDQPPLNISEWANSIASAANISKPRMIPYFVFKFFAIVGDIAKTLKIKAIMTSFRLRNMTTDNIIHLDNTYKTCGPVPFRSIEGIKRTLDWMKSKKCKNI